MNFPELDKKTKILGSVWIMFSLLVIILGSLYSSTADKMEALLPLGFFSMIITLPILAKRGYVPLLLFMMAFFGSVVYVARSAAGLLVTAAYSGNLTTTQDFLDVFDVKAGYAFFILFIFLYLIAYKITMRNKKKIQTPTQV